MIKLLYKPFGLVLGMLSAVAAGKLSNMVWRTLSGQDTAIEPMLLRDVRRSEAPRSAPLAARSATWSSAA